MKTLIISSTVLLLAAALTAQPQAERGTAMAKWDAGSMNVEYGVPTWNDGFAGAIKEGTVWRFGNNLPTSCTVDCGLESANGPITPGSYKLALKYVKEGLAHLLVYQGSTFYAEGLPTYEIASDSVTKDDTKKAEKFAVKFDGAKMHAAFGPYTVIFTMKPIKAHPPVETAFANVKAKITTLALPLPEGAVKDMKVGVADVVMNGIKTAYGLFLNLDGDKGSLAFKNPDASTVTTDKATLNGIVANIKKMIEAKPEMKEMAGSFVTMFEGQLAELEKKEKALGRLSGDKMIDGTLSKREKPASTLEFSSERPTGKMVLRFGAQGQDAAFEINPRDFMMRRGG